MEKKYEKYFGKNIARIIYLIGIGFIAVGVASIFGYSGYWGGVFCTIGVILFFITSASQVSDKQIDELVQKTADGYASERIEGKTIGKQTLKASDFSVFNGYIRDSGEVRFKAGSDSKVRTSRFYVTAISAEKNDCKIFTTVYDILSDGSTVDRIICTKGADSVELKRENVEFPRGNVKCDIKVVRGDSVEELTFYVPDDALADKLLEKIK